MQNARGVALHLIFKYRYTFLLEAEAVISST
ncbi:hypothetical protein VIF_002848 [Vibrio cholerae TM 11079-80]|nr:hypothetical protein VIF_002848 [Vibrio cholerae TM 11079-80]